MSEYKMTMISKFELLKTIGQTSGLKRQLEMV